MIQNRKQVKYEAVMPQENLQQLFSEYANSIKEYVRRNAHADQIETQQDFDLIICGYGATETTMSYGEGYACTEKDGEIMMGRLDPLTVGWDPQARAPNLIDRRWNYYYREFSEEDALNLFDNSEIEDFEVSTSDENKDDYVFYDRDGYNAISTYEYANKKEKLLRVYFYQWYEIETFYRIPNPLLESNDPLIAEYVTSILQKVAAENEDFKLEDEILVFDDKVKRQLSELLEFLEIEPFDFKKKVHYMAVLSGDKVFDKFKLLTQQGFTVQFKTGHFFQQQRIWTGLVNGMMEPVLWYNKALTELLYTIAANSKGGVMLEEDAVPDIEEFEANYNRTDSAVPVNPGALMNGKIQSKAKPAVPTGLDSIISLSDGAIADVTGIDPSFLGSREFKQDTADFHRRRVKQVMSSLASYFDAADLYQKIHARILLDLMKVFVENNKGLSIRALGEEGKAVFLQLNTAQLSAEYDIATVEAPMSQEDKQEQARILTTMAEKVTMIDPKSAKAIYGVALDLMPIDFAQKQKVKEQFEEEQPIDPAYVKQLEEQLQQLASEGSRAQLEKTLADAQEKLAKVRHTEAETVKTLEESKNIALEAELASQLPVEDINISL
jgi:hypothetical protein